MNSPTPVVEWLTALENRLTALESHRCNCSAASSAGSGGTTTSPSDASSERPKTTPTTSSTTNAPAAAVAADPVSAAIRADPNRPAWLTDEMLPLPEGTKRVYHDPGADGLWAYPGQRVWDLRREGEWAKSVIDETSCVEIVDEDEPPEMPFNPHDHDDEDDDDRGGGRPSTPTPVSSAGA